MSSGSVGDSDPSPVGGGSAEGPDQPGRSSRGHSVSRGAPAAYGSDRVERIASSALQRGTPESKGMKGRVQQREALGRKLKGLASRLAGVFTKRPATNDPAVYGCSCEARNASRIFR